MAQELSKEEELSKSVRYQFSEKQHGGGSAAILALAELQLFPLDKQRLMHQLLPYLLLAWMGPPMLD
jgi:hypothetical protein